MPFAAVLFLIAQCCDSVTIRFHVEATTPDGLPVCVVGNLEPLGSWDEGNALELRQDAPGAWVGVARVPTGSELVCAIIRGSWAAEATTSTGMRMPDMSFVATADTTIQAEVQGWEDDGVRHGGVAGELIIHRNVTSSHVPGSRDVRVVLPRTYRTGPEARFPVLYVNDGQDAFEAVGSMNGVEWGLDEAQERLSAQGVIPEIILVGIGASASRIYEYADTILGQAYARFVVEELKPMIDSHYRTRVEPTHTAVVGTSLGGLGAFLLAWWHPDAIGQAACLSPFLVWGDGAVLRRIEHGRAPTARARFFMCACDARIDSLQGSLNSTLCEGLTKAGWTMGDDLRCVRIPGVAQGAPDWPTIWDETLRFLYPLDPGGQGTEEGHSDTR